MSDESDTHPHHSEDASLSAVSPDHAEEVMAPSLDNVIPTAGYNKMAVVGIGGSAGSIRELQKFFGSMPADSGMAFVVVLHLSPEHESLLAEVIQRETTMPVIQVSKNTSLQRNSVYVIPPAKHLSMINGHLALSDLSPVTGKRVAVDLFFRTLADTHGPHATAIILSGADSDGAIGIKRIKERGGLTVVQDPTEASFDSMPRSAIKTGMVDWVLPVGAMAQRLVEYHHAESQIRLPPEEGPSLEKVDQTSPTDTPDSDEALLREILIFLRMRTGREFAYYKRATVVRRIGRRIQVNGLTDLASYLTFMRTNPGEAGALLKDLLISVTNFFRDRDAFQSVEKIIAELFEGKGLGDTVRVWVAACATGEEAYSIAMLLCEHAATLSSPPSIQVFATDLDEDAIAAARDGAYPDTITADVSGERLRQFFVKEQSGYRIKRSVRELVLFATHDLLKDSPFSRLDLISSRNLLIYLNKEAQARVFDIFHFALKPGGKLFLGASESVDEGGNLFHPIDKRGRLYSRRDVTPRGYPVQNGQNTLARALAAQQKGHQPAAYSLGNLEPSQGQASVSGLVEGRLGRTSSWGDLHFKLIERFSPPSVIVNADHEIIHLSGHAGRYLKFIGGETTVNLLRVVDPSMRVELRAALFRAAQTGKQVEVKGLSLGTDGGKERIDLFVSPAHSQQPDFLLVVFQPRVASTDEPNRQSVPEPVMHQLEQELMQVKEDLRSTEEQYGASIEELKAANEELQAMNEELRSTTEEMETGREELQSINEELTTVNQEAKGKVEELSRAISDLQNLMASTAIATVFLDRELRIQLYTPSAAELFNIIPTDTGRPLSNLAHRLNYPDVIRDANQVLENLAVVEREVSDEEGRCFLARVLPYRTADEKIAGVVLTFLNITGLKKTEDSLRHREVELVENTMAKEVAEAATKSKDHFMAVLSHELRTPLTPVIMMLPTLLETPGLDGSSREIVEMISRNVDLEAALIDQILEFTRLSRGKVILCDTPLDAHEVVRHAIQVTSGEMEAKNQTLQVDLDAESHLMTGDATRLQQVVWNLLKNASKFTPEGGHIHVTTHNEGDRLMLKITDNGMGIPKEHTAEIFNAFEQGDLEITKKFGGLGLGLAISRAAVEAHRGRISVSSPGKGKGSTFTVELPLKAPPRETPQV